MIASIAVDLPEHHSDPQDRIIIATTMSHDAQLMSADGKFPKYNEIVDRLVQISGPHLFHLNIIR